MDSGDIIRILLEQGWKLNAVRGSHHQFHHETRKGKVTVPHPRRDIPVGTMKAIERQAGVRLLRR